MCGQRREKNHGKILSDVRANNAKHNHKLDAEKTKPKFRLNLFILINYFPFIRVLQRDCLAFASFFLLRFFFSFHLRCDMFRCFFAFVWLCTFFLIRKYSPISHYSIFSGNFSKASHYQCNFLARTFSHFRPVWSNSVRFFFCKAHILLRWHSRWHYRRHFIFSFVLLLQFGGARWKVPTCNTPSCKLSIESTTKSHTYEISANEGIS